MKEAVVVTSARRFAEHVSVPLTNVVTRYTLFAWMKNSRRLMMWGWSRRHRILTSAMMSAHVLSLLPTSWPGADTSMILMANASPVRLHVPACTMSQVGLILFYQSLQVSDFQFSGSARAAKTHWHLPLREWHCGNDRAYRLLQVRSVA